MGSKGKNKGSIIQGQYRGTYRDIRGRDSHIVSNHHNHHKKHGKKLVPSKRMKKR